MTENERITALYDMMYLTGCAVNGIAPKGERVGKMVLENVYKVSREHFLNAITFYAVEGAGLPDSDVLKKWRESRDKAIRKNMLLNAGRAQLAAYMESSGIWHMPLKGVYLQDMYPRSGMRQMSDNDILFDEKYRKDVHDWFLKNGYECTEYNKGNHDAYEKKPVFSYEMHTSLFFNNSRESLQRYYADVYGRLLKAEGTQYMMRFTDEDFYLYITAHSYKHYENAGTGLRSLLDTYVYVKEKGDGLDWDYIEREAEKMEMGEFEKQCRELSVKVFTDPDSYSDDKLSETELKMLMRFFRAGTYGNLGIQVTDRLEKMQEDSGSTSKLDYFRRRLFPDDEYLKKWFPFFYRHKWLMPICWIFRIFRGLTVRRKRVAGELKVLKNMENKENKKETG